MLFIIYVLDVKSSPKPAPLNLSNSQTQQQLSQSSPQTPSQPASPHVVPKPLSPMTSRSKATTAATNAAKTPPPAKGMAAIEVKGQKMYVPVADEFKGKGVNTDPPQERLKLEWM